MLLTLGEAKEYLKVEFEDEDTLILTLLSTAEGVCSDILRKDLSEESDVAKTAVLFGVLYENRGTDIKELIPTLKSILSGRRKAVF